MLWTVILPILSRSWSRPMNWWKKWRIEASEIFWESMNQILDQYTYMSAVDKKHCGSSIRNIMFQARWWWSSSSQGTNSQWWITRRWVNGFCPLFEWWVGLKLFPKYTQKWMEFFLTCSLSLPWKHLMSSCASIRFMGENTWLKKAGELLRIYVLQWETGNKGWI